MCDFAKKLKLDIFVKADNLFVFSSDVDLEELTLV